MCILLIGFGVGFELQLENGVFENLTLPTHVGLLSLHLQNSYNCLLGFYNRLTLIRNLII